MHGRASEITVFPFYLAEKLGKTLAEIKAMPHTEYLQWSAYYTAKDAIANKR